MLFPFLHVQRPPSGGEEGDGLGALVLQSGAGGRGQTTWTSCLKEI